MPALWRRTVLVGVVGLLGARLVARLLGRRPWGIAAIALANPRGGLVNCPRRGVSRPVGVELGVVACGVRERCFVSSYRVRAHTQQLVDVLQS